MASLFLCLLKYQSQFIGKFFFVGQFSCTLLASTFFHSKGFLAPQYYMISSFEIIFLANFSLRGDCHFNGGVVLLCVLEKYHNSSYQVSSLLVNFLVLQKRNYKSFESHNFKFQTQLIVIFNPNLSLNPFEMKGVIFLFKQCTSSR